MSPRNSALLTQKRGKDAEPRCEEKARGVACACVQLPVVMADLHLGNGPKVDGFNDEVITLTPGMDKKISRCLSTCEI